MGEEQGMCLFRPGMQRWDGVLGLILSAATASVNSVSVQFSGPAINFDGSHRLSSRPLWTSQSELAFDGMLM